jgi:hypothetical protein
MHGLFTSRHPSGQQRRYRRRKAPRERSTQFEAWRRQGINALLAGRYGDEARNLIEFLGAITLEAGPELIKRCGPWVTADADTRFLVLSLIDHAIIELREKHEIIRECLA